MAHPASKGIRRHLIRTRARIYVVFNASGGWDTTYLMDPKGVNENQSDCTRKVIS